MIIIIIIFNSIIIIIIVVFFLLASTADWIELLSLKEVNAQRTPVLRCAVWYYSCAGMVLQLRCARYYSFH